MDGVAHTVPHDDCWAAHQWVRTGGHGIATDPGLVLVVGGSAGACLAASVALHGRDAGCPPAGVFLVYPIVHCPLPGPSAELAAVLAIFPPSWLSSRRCSAGRVERPHRGDRPGPGG